MISSYPTSYASGPRHLRPAVEGPPTLITPYQSGTPEEEEELALLQRLEQQMLEQHEVGGPSQPSAEEDDDEAEDPPQAEDDDAVDWPPAGREPHEHPPAEDEPPPHSWHPAMDEGDAEEPEGKLPTQSRQPPPPPAEQEMDEAHELAAENALPPSRASLPPPRTEVPPRLAPEHSVEKEPAAPDRATWFRQQAVAAGDEPSSAGSTRLLAEKDNIRLMSDRAYQSSKNARVGGPALAAPPPGQQGPAPAKPPTSAPPVKQPPQTSQQQPSQQTRPAPRAGDPRPTFTNPQAARVDALHYIYSLQPTDPGMSPDSMEIGVTVYKLPGKDKNGEDQYSYTEPYQNRDSGTINFRDDLVPKGATVDSYAHNHPIVPPRGSYLTGNRVKFSNRGNTPGRVPGDMEYADNRGRPVLLITRNPVANAKPEFILKQYTPAKTDTHGNVITKGFAQEYDEETGRFGPEKELVRPPATVPEWIGRGVGTEKYKMPDGSEVEVPRGDPPPAWPREGDKGNK